MSDIFFLVLRKLRLPLILLIAVYSVATLGMTLIPGIDDAGQPWHMNFFHAFYFVSFMGTTIGFGEIPYAFTDQQRAWVLLCIYASVITWLYAIGTVLSLSQDTMFKQAISNGAFKRSIRRIDMPFYIIGGFGETGSLINRGLADLGVQTVIIEQDSERTNSLELLDLAFQPVVLTADTTVPENLLAAGMNHPYCQGVIAVTNDDHTNLKIALNCKLLNHKIPVICRSEVQDEADNMASFGTDQIVNPFLTFARQLNLFTKNPGLHQLQNWFINQHGATHSTKRQAPKGLWIVCSYGRLGKAIEQHLTDIGIQIVLVDANPDLTQAPGHTIVGRGTEANTLLKAGIMDASVIVAASSDDANNLSILMTAAQLNEDIYSIGRVNEGTIEVLFVKAGCDYIIRGSRVIANEILTLISRPLVTNFIKGSGTLADAQISALVNNINALTNKQDPITWRLVIDRLNAPALVAHLEHGRKITIAQVCHHKSKPKENGLPLLLERDGQSQLLPDEQLELQLGDELLIAGQRGATLLAQHLSDNIELVDSLINANPHHIPLLRWLRRRNIALTSE